MGRGGNINRSFFFYLAVKIFLGTRVAVNLLHERVDLPPDIISANEISSTHLDQN